LGWIPDVPDQRDHLYSAPPASLIALPPMVDLRPQCPPVYDQLDIGSCTANALAGAIEFDQMREHFSAPFTPSRLFIYYNERAIEQTTAVDSGASLRDGMKTIVAQGACPEALWPYKDDGNAFAQRPSPSCYATASLHRAIAYSRVPRLLAQIKACLASGFPMAYGFSVYESFMSDAVAASGVVPMPAPGEQLVGGHAVLAVGYNDARGVMIVRNSWGAQWGKAGYFQMPYEYFLETNLSDDFWTVRRVS
jgi:C1A family cysteine protease